MRGQVESDRFIAHEYLDSSAHGILGARMGTEAEREPGGRRQNPYKGWPR